MYGTGLGVPADPAASAAWYRRAAEQGERTAQHNLAVMLFRGDGVERDPEAAVEWYRRAAEQGLPEAQTALGDLYARGIGVAADPEAARAWYEKAAAQGHAPAQAKLAALRGPRIVATVQPLQVRTRRVRRGEAARRRRGMRPDGRSRLSSVTRHSGVRGSDGVPTAWSSRHKLPASILRDRIAGATHGHDAA